MAQPAKSRHRPACMLACGLLAAAMAWAGPEAAPLLWGFDDIGVRGEDCWNEACLLSHPRAGELLEEFELDLWVTWYPDAACTWSTERNRAYIEAIDAFCARQDIAWIANPLPPLWNHAPEYCIGEGGHDWYNRPDGRHFYQFPEALLESLGQCSRLLGITYDEPAHHQNNNNAVPGLDKPALFDWRGVPMFQAADAHTRAARELAAYHEQFGIPLFTEHVIPVMLHNFARAGFTPSVKVLKESWSPVYLACAMGAARQYQRPFWVTADLWGTRGYPGHSPLHYQSALLLAYHLGADCIYTESLALDEGGRGVGSLVLMTPSSYAVKPLGEVAKWFIGAHVPEHPRAYRVADARPKVAIVRMEDGCHGQRAVPFSFMPDRRYGNPAWISTPETEAWISLWHLLTRGAAPTEGLLWWAYPDKPYQVSCPLDGVLVFDHHARRRDLEGARVIFLTGLMVSDATLEAVAALVAEGAACIGPARLLPPAIGALTGGEGLWPEGKGWWLAAEDFLSEPVRELAAHVLPRDNAVRYAFGNTEVALHPAGGDWNHLRVEERRYLGPLREPIVRRAAPPKPAG